MDNRQRTFGMQSFFILPPCGTFEHTCKFQLQQSISTKLVKTPQINTSGSSSMNRCNLDFLKIK